VVTKVFRSPKDVLFGYLAETSDGKYLVELSDMIYGNPGVSFPSLARFDKGFNFLSASMLPLGSNAPYTTRAYAHLDGLTANQFGGAFAPYFKDTSIPGARSFGLTAALNCDSTINFFPSAIAGRIINDKDHNCAVDPTDRGIPNKLVTLSEVGGSARFYAVSDSVGSYSRPMPAGTWNMTHYIAPNKAAECPVAGFPNVNMTSPVSLSNYNFYDTLRSAYRDMRVLLAPTRYVPGFTRPMNIYVSNNGGAGNSDTLTVICPSSVTLPSATPTPTSVSGNTMTWIFNNLPADSTAHIAIDVKIPATMAINTQLSFYARISCMNDSRTVDNADTETVTVIGSFDPNDKMVNRPLKTTANKGWVYTVQFQNTGNYPAQDVVVIDYPDARLDPATFQFLQSSHKAPKINWKKDGSIEFRFDNIYLADSVHNEPASHGSFTYTMSPGVNAKVGDTLQNTAAIFFDYNSPVYTNTTKNILTDKVVVTQPQSVGVVAGSHRFSVYPNPSTGQITLTTDVDGKAYLYDVQGRCVLSLSLTAGKKQVQLPETLSRGLYILQARSNEGEMLGAVRLVVE
jgi:uncharacterized repeat protein (TIGR01451 family)